MNLFEESQNDWNITEVSIYVQSIYVLLNKLDIEQQKAGNKCFKPEFDPDERLSFLLSQALSIQR